MARVELFSDTFENRELGFQRIRRATLLPGGKVELWEHTEIEGRDGEPGTGSDRADFWSLRELEIIVEAARGWREYHVTNGAH